MKIALPYSADLFFHIFEFLSQDFAGARKYDVPLRTRLRAWRYGFHSKGWVWLDLDHKNPRNYISNIYYKRVLTSINGAYGGVFDDAVAFYNASAEFRRFFPKHYGVIEEGAFHPFTESQSLSEILADEGELIFKPICGMQGEGIHYVQANSTTERDIQEFLCDLDGYLVSEYIKQHEYASAIAPGSANTIRFYTILDRETKEPYLLRAVHRFGTEASAPTDNWSQGGLCAPIDLNTGEIGTSFYQDDVCGHIKKVDKHPETEVQIEGVKIPHWHETLELVRELSSHHDRASYVGWDVLIAPDGPRIIEANSSAGIHLPQLKEGLRTDKFANEFFQNSAVE